MLNDDYYDKTGLKTLLNVPVIPMRNLDLNDEKIFLCMGYTHYSIFDTEIVPPRMKGKFLSADVMVFMDKSGRGNCLDHKYFEDKCDKFEYVYNLLEDEKSKRVLEAFLNQRISAKLMYLEKEREENQYFDSTIIDFAKIRYFVDCGAYNGDTYIAFKKNYKVVTGKAFEGDAWLWEPDPYNVKKIKEVINDSVKIHIIGKGVGKEKGMHYFNRADTSGNFIDEGKGEYLLEIDSLDNLIFGQGNGGFIKMDIEGSEYDAIKGAQNIISTYRPDMAICVYHKRDDLLKIPELIRNIYGGYKFYLRAYDRYSTEIVLYAVTN